MFLYVSKGQITSDEKNKLTHIWGKIYMLSDIQFNGKADLLFWMLSLCRFIKRWELSEIKKKICNGITKVW